jgi:hypothetical protein
MMKKNIIVCFVVSVLMLGYSSAFAGNPTFFTRLMPSKGNFAFAGRGGLVFANNNNIFVGTGVLSYGIASGITLNGNFGAGQNPFDPYFGGDLRFTLASSRNGIGFDIYGGGHGGGFGAGFDAGAVISGNLSGVGIFGGVDIDFITSGGVNATPINLIGGIDFAISRNVAFIVNADFAINDEARSGISAGLQFLF